MNILTSQQLDVELEREVCGGQVWFTVMTVIFIWLAVWWQFVIVIQLAVWWQLLSLSNLLYVNSCIIYLACCVLIIVYIYLACCVLTVLYFSSLLCVDNWLHLSSLLCDDSLVYLSSLLCVEFRLYGQWKYNRMSKDFHIYAFLTTSSCWNNKNKSPPMDRWGEQRNYNFKKMLQQLTGLISFFTKL